MSVADLNASITATLTLLQQIAPITNSAVDSLQSGESQITVMTHSIMEQVNAANGSFASLLKQIGQYQAFGGIGGDVSSHPEIGPDGQPTGRQIFDSMGGATSIGDLLQKLGILVEEQKAINSGKVQTSGADRFNIEDSIEKIVQLIRTWGGPAASAFNLEKFKQLLNSGGGAQAVATSLGISPSAAAPAGGAASLGNDAVAKAGTPPTPAKPRYALLPGQTAPADESLSAEQKQLDKLNASADVLNAAVSTAEATLQSANKAMTDLATKAGVDSKNGAVQKLNDQLQEAQSTLQYFQDKGRSAADVAKQQSVVDAIQKQLDEANKQLRITVYDFEHSDAYKKQMDAIAAAQKDLDAKQKAADDNTAKIDALQKKIDDATKAASDAADTVKKVGGAMILSLSATGETVTKVLKTESVTAAARISDATDGAVTTLTQTFASFVSYLKKGVKQPGTPIGGGALIPTSVNSAISLGLM